MKTNEKRNEYILPGVICLVGIALNYLDPDPRYGVMVIVTIWAYWLGCAWLDRFG